MVNAPVVVPTVSFNGGPWDGVERRWTMLWPIVATPDEVPNAEEYVTGPPPLSDVYDRTIIHVYHRGTVVWQNNQPTLVKYFYQGRR